MTALAPGDYAYVGMRGPKALRFRTGRIWDISHRGIARLIIQDVGEFEVPLDCLKAAPPE